MNGVAHGSAGAPPAGPAAAPGATEATLLDVKTGIADVLAELKDDKFFTDILWEASGTFYRQTRTLDQDTGTVTTTVVNAVTGATIALPVGARPVGSNATRELRETDYVAADVGTGYAIGNKLELTEIIDLAVTPPVVIGTLWVNRTTGLSLAAAPTAGTYALPPAAATPTAASRTRTYRAIAASVGNWSVGDVIDHEPVIDSTGSVIAEQFWNRSTLTVVGTPTVADVEPIEDPFLETAVNAVDNTAGTFAAPVIGAEWAVKPVPGEEWAVTPGTDAVWSAVRVPAVAKETAQWKHLYRWAAINPATGARTLLGASWLLLDGTAYAGPGPIVETIEAYGYANEAPCTNASTVTFPEPVETFAIQNNNGGTITIAMFADTTKTVPLGTLTITAGAVVEAPLAGSLMRCFTIACTSGGTVYYFGSRPAFGR